MQKMAETQRHIRPKKRSTTGKKSIVAPSPPRSILKPSQYEKRATVDAEAEHETDTAPSSEWPSRTVPKGDGPVKDFVVERRRPRQRRNETNLERDPATLHPQAVEGYIPQINNSQKKISNKTVQIDESINSSIKDHDDNDNDDDNDKEEPLVFSSLAELMAAAGTLPDPNDTSPAAIETELSFSCLSPDDYRREQQAVCLGQLSPFVAADDGEETDENSSPVSDSEPENHDDGDDNDDLWGLFGGELDEEEDDAEPAPPPRSFLILHDAISQLVSPLAVCFVRDVRNHKKPNYMQEPQTDIELSRCAALMDVVKLHLSYSMMEELVEIVPLQSTVENSISQLLRLFDYRQPSPKLDLAHARALTCVLVDTILNSQTPTVPSCCDEIGMTLEEYRYLTHSAILNFDSDLQ